MKDDKWFEDKVREMLDACGIDDVDGPDTPSEWLKNIYNIGFSDGIKDSEETMDDVLKYACYA